MIPFSQFYFSENKNSKKLRNRFLKMEKNISLDCDDILLLRNVFFSDENVELINKQLVLTIYKQSEKKYLIDYQNSEKINIIMNYVYINYSKNYNCNIPQQIKELNTIVVGELTQPVLSEVKLRIHYLNDIATGKKLLQLPEHSRKSKMLASIDSLL